VAIVGIVRSSSTLSNSLWRMIARLLQELLHIMDEKRVENVSDLLFIRIVKRTLKRDPVQSY